MQSSILHKTYKKTPTQEKLLGESVALSTVQNIEANFRVPFSGIELVTIRVRGGSDSDEPLGRQMDSDGTTCNTE